MTPTFIYLHGWASSPGSVKAQFFQQRLAQHQIDVLLPDLNQNDFYHLTLSRQIQQVEALIRADERVILLGSSFGALTALWVAQRQPQVERLVLLAPAVNFVANCQRFLGDEQWQHWQDSGTINVFHSAINQSVALHYEFARDLARYPEIQLQRALPTLVLHGIQDEIIPFQDVQQFVAQRPWITFTSWDCDHAMLDVQADLWKTMERWLF